MLAYNIKYGKRKKNEKKAEQSSRTRFSLNLQRNSDSTKTRGYRDKKLRQRTQMEIPHLSNSRKYGIPFYAAAWVPSISLRSNHEPPRSQTDPQKAADADVSAAGDKQETPKSDNDTDQADVSAAGHKPETPKSENDRDQAADADVSATDDNTPPSSAALDYVVVAAGGGGEGRSGISNALVLARFDFGSRSLSDQPVAKHGTGSDLPYRMAVHPAGDGIICSLPKSCCLFKLDTQKDAGDQKLGLKLSQEVLSQLEDVGQQLALVFNNEGSLLATGGENGNLRVFKWPSLDIILNEPSAHSSVKDLDFSSDGKYLVSLGGPCRVWDVTSSTVVTALPKENGEVFISCRFSLANNGNMVLYTATMTGKGGNIITWNASSWRRMASKLITRDNITAFNVSANGKLLACGTTQGDVLIINSTSMRVHKIVKKAHLGFVTALSFSHDSRALASASMDSSARVTVIEQEQKKGMNMWVIIFILLIAIAAYFINNAEFLKIELPIFSSSK